MYLFMIEMLRLAELMGANGTPQTANKISYDSVYYVFLNMEI